MASSSEYNAATFTLNEALPWFELESLDGLSLEELKRRFKKSLVKHHPDRGGKAGDFDHIVGAYEFLSAFLKRGMGGRERQGVLSVEEVIKHRDHVFVTEMNNLVSEVFDELSRASDDSFLVTFNHKFDALRLQSQMRCEEMDDTEHAQMMKRYEEECVVRDEKNLAEMKHEARTKTAQLNREQTMKRYEEECALRTEEAKQQEEAGYKDTTLLEGITEEFIQTAKTTRATNAPSEALILHLDEMAYVDGTCYGMDIICRDERHHSSLFCRPEFSDYVSVYSSESIVLDKLPDYTEPTAEDIEQKLKERELVYECLEDEEMKEIDAYEKRMAEKEAREQKEVAFYFTSHKLSTWALMNGAPTAYGTLPNGTSSLQKEWHGSVTGTCAMEKETAMYVEQAQVQEQAPAAAAAFSSAMGGDAIVQAILKDMRMGMGVAT